MRIKMITTKFAKINKRWIETIKYTSMIEKQFYTNVIESKQFMINLGGYERHDKSYTCNGYIVTHINSISPDRNNKTVYDFDFIINPTFKDEIEVLNKDSFVGGLWLDNDTYISSILLTTGLKELFKNEIGNDSVDLVGEYWVEENSYHYMLVFDDDTIYVNDKLNCDHLNNAFKEAIEGDV